MNVKNATHSLECRHCIGPIQRKYYSMKCIILKKMKDGRLKVLVFGDRYWAYQRTNKKRIRYVEAHRVKKL